MKTHFQALAALFMGLVLPASAGPLKIYLLVGQSNMQGHAAERTLEHLGMDPKTAPLLKAIRNADGTACRKMCGFLPSNPRWNRVRNMGG